MLGLVDGGVGALVSGQNIRTFVYVIFFFFNDTATTEIYTLSLHDALPISAHVDGDGVAQVLDAEVGRKMFCRGEDRKSTRLNSSHSQISYAVFCLKKKKRTQHTEGRVRIRCPACT